MLRVPSSTWLSRFRNSRLSQTLIARPLAALAADPDAFRIVARIAERRGAAGADPFAAALVPALLLREPLFQRLHDLFPGAERLDLGHLLGGEIELGDRLQPFLRDRRLLGAVAGLDPLEDLGEDLVEPVEQPLVLHEDGAGEIVELLRRRPDHLGVERLEQHQMLLHRGRNARRAQLVDEGEEHGVLGLAERPGSAPPEPRGRSG